MMRDINNNNSIQLHKVKTAEQLDEIIADYGRNGIVVKKVERTNDCLYNDGEVMYTLHLEENSMQPYYLFLDDIRMPDWVYWVTLPTIPTEWTIVRSYNAFCDVIRSKGIPEFVCYDHILEENDHHYDGPITDEKTGYDCARFLCEECRNEGVAHPSFLVHSMDPVGRENIIHYIKHGYLSPK